MGEFPYELWNLLTTQLCNHVTTILLVCLVLLIFQYPWNHAGFTKQLPKMERVLLLTAHPDDEVMFFGPVLLHMVKQIRSHFYILCLSAGDHERKGIQRQYELWECCKKLGVPESNITMLKYEELKDDPNVKWPVDLISRVIENHMLSLGIETVITFDEGGVSGHLNHIACSKAAVKLLAQPRQIPHVRVYVLESVGLIRKYFLNAWDVVFSYYNSEYVYVLNRKQRADVVAGMRCHMSQLTWYRKVYIIMSRYILVNSFREVRRS